MTENERGFEEWWSEYWAKLGPKQGGEASRRATASVAYLAGFEAGARGEREKTEAARTDAEVRNRELWEERKAVQEQIDHSRRLAGMVAALKEALQLAQDTFAGWVSAAPIKHPVWAAMAQALSSTESAAREFTERIQREAQEAERSRLHRCKVCGAIWRLNPPTPGHCNRPGCYACNEESWSVLTPHVMGKCCDNVGMGAQIETLSGRALNDKGPRALGTKEGA